MKKEDLIGALERLVSTLKKPSVEVLGLEVDVINDTRETSNGDGWVVHGRTGLVNFNLAFKLYDEENNDFKTPSVEEKRERRCNQ